MCPVLEVKQMKKPQNTVFVPNIFLLVLAMYSHMESFIFSLASSWTKIKLAQKD